jgi:arylsulfatase A-like enzyme
MRIRLRPVIWCSVLAASVGCGQRARPPDLILLSIDTLRADHLGAWGYERDTSPFLDRMAGEGTRFANAWSAAPWTLPSQATILSGALPQEHGAIEQRYAIDKNVPWLPQILHETGYATLAVVTSMYVSAKFDFDRGFDHFVDLSIGEDGIDPQLMPDAQEVFDTALQWTAGQRADQPLFLFLHVYDAHWPYDAPAPFDTQFDEATPGMVYKNYHYYLKHPLSDEAMAHLVAQYDEEIRYVDAMLERFWKRWQETRGDRDVTFMVVADHGEEFGERGSWGHAHTLTPEQLHVPWIAWGSGVRAQVIDDRVGMEDVAPTLAALAGATLASRTGIAREAQLRAGVAPADTRVAAPLASTTRFRTLMYRWHRRPYDLIFDMNRYRYALYDLTQDPKATVDLSSQHVDVVRDLNQEMFAFLGQPWEAKAAGLLTTNGVFVVDGIRQNQTLEVAAGQHFAVFPLEAKITLADADGRTSGPWQILGGSPPPDGDWALAWSGRPADVDLPELSEQEREHLRALGYLN